MGCFHLRLCLVLGWKYSGYRWILHMYLEAVGLFFLTYIFGGLSFFRVTYLITLAVITTNTDNMDDDCNRCIVGALDCTHVLHHSLFLPYLLYFSFSFFSLSLFLPCV
ncbi:hypothetical protein BDV33DRAFT_98752 [Aspergillus novoparasiticus]|uniref:Uncharacterized protein n=1 Tax=Aspergillus novoparasiticus TaxID=986946 RepID=A0A5N6ERV9_9EURO|nr:hypothetical protein BDV33DRAFT_98752 [Aspergillus novoparasiticus]